MIRKIVLVTTGGTISMVAEAGAGGAVPTLRGPDLARLLPAWSGPLEVVEYSHMPTAHYTLETLWGLQEQVQEILRRPEVGGVVITHGTDTMEETAYLLDLTVEGEAPMVLTGSMRAASDPGYEGPANLLAALHVAAAPESRGIGAVIVAEEEIHAARTVTKMHTTSPSTFQSPFWGPLGRVDGERVLLRRPPERHVLRTPRLEEKVLLLKLAVAMEDALLRYALGAGMRGVVLEALGGGRVPPWWMETIRQAIAQGVAVVVTTRCAAGPCFDRYGYAGAHQDLLRAGVLFADGLNGPKARLKLMAALGAGLAGEELKQAFARQP